jgi:DNA-binding transcriptional ArsR family regulator
MTKRSMEEEKEYHRRYLRAITHPVRKRILRILQEQSMTAKKLASRLGTDRNNLAWHLELLEYGYCIAQQPTEEDVVYVLTKEGEVINYLDGSE